MAIKKSKALPSGISGEYWKITKESYDRIAGRGVWTISLFKDQAASDAGAQPLSCSKNFSLPMSPQELAGNRTAIAYNKIKARAAEVVPVAFSTTPATCIFDPDLADGEDV